MQLGRPNLMLLMTKSGEKMTHKAELSESLEDYLEMILMLSEKEGHVHSKALAEAMKVKTPSVTGALQLLAADGLIRYTPYMPVVLTEKGRLRAEKVVKRHMAIKDFLVSVLGINDAEADETACRMEHAVGETIAERLAALSVLMSTCHRAEALKTDLPASPAKGCLETFINRYCSK